MAGIPEFKLVLVGDGGVGKTTLVKRSRSRVYPQSFKTDARRSFGGSYPEPENRNWKLSVVWMGCRAYPPAACRSGT
eukprot:5472438-Amphidinium_carterae.1